jgi:hypothetical protein
MLLRLVAAIHCALGTALGIAQLILIVTFRSFEMVLCCSLMVGCCLFMEAAGFIGV